MGSHTKNNETKKQVGKRRRASPKKQQSIMASKQWGGAMTLDDFTKKMSNEKTEILRTFLNSHGYDANLISDSRISKNIEYCNRTNKDINCIFETIANRIVRNQCKNNNKQKQESIRLAKKLQGELINSLSGKETTPGPQTPIRTMPTLVSSSTQSFPSQPNIVSRSTTSSTSTTSYVLPTMAESIAEIVSGTRQLQNVDNMTNTALDVSTSMLSSAAAKLQESNNKLVAAVQERNSARASNKDTAELNAKIAELKKEKAEQENHIKTLRDEKTQLEQLHQTNTTLTQELASAKHEIQKARLAGRNEITRQKQAELDELTKKIEEATTKSTELHNKLQQDLDTEKQENKQKISELLFELETLNTQKATNNEDKAKKDDEINNLRAELAKYKADEAKRLADEEKLKKEQEEFEENTKLLEQELEKNKLNINTTELISKNSSTHKEQENENILGTLINDEIPTKQFLKNIRQVATNPLKDYEIKYILLQIIKKIGESQEWNIASLEDYQLGGTEPEDPTQFIIPLANLYNSIRKKNENIPFPEIFDGFDSQEDFEKFYESVNNIVVSEKPKPVVVQANPVELPKELLEDTDEETNIEKYKKAKKISMHLAAFLKKIGKYQNSFNIPEKDRYDASSNTTNYNIPDTKKDTVEKLIGKLNDIIAKLNKSITGEEQKIPELKDDATNLEDVMSAIKKGMDDEETPKSTIQNPIIKKQSYSEASEDKQKELFDAYKQFISSKSTNNKSDQRDFLNKCTELNIDCGNLSSNTKFNEDKAKLIETTQRLISGSKSEFNITDIESLLKINTDLQEQINEYLIIPATTNNSMLSTAKIDEIKEKYNLSNSQLTSVIDYVKKINYMTDINKNADTLNNESIIELNGLLTKYKKNDAADESNYKKVYDEFARKVGEIIKRKEAEIQQNLTAENKELMKKTHTNTQKPNLGKNNKAWTPEETAEFKAKNEAMANKVDTESQQITTPLKDIDSTGNIGLFSSVLKILYKLKKNPNFIEIINDLKQNKISEKTKGILNDNQINQEKDIEFFLKFGNLLKNFNVPRSGDIYEAIQDHLRQRITRKTVVPDNIDDLRTEINKIFSDYLKERYQISKGTNASTINKYTVLINAVGQYIYGEPVDFQPGRVTLSTYGPEKKLIEDTSSAKLKEVSQYYIRKTDKDKKTPIDDNAVLGKLNEFINSFKEYDKLSEFFDILTDKITESKKYSISQSANSGKASSTGTTNLKAEQQNKSNIPISQTWNATSDKYLEWTVKKKNKFIEDQYNKDKFGITDDNKNIQISPEQLAEFNKEYNPTNEKQDDKSPPFAIYANDIKSYIERKREEERKKQIEGGRAITPKQLRKYMTPKRRHHKSGPSATRRYTLKLKNPKN